MKLDKLQVWLLASAAIGAIAAFLPIGHIVGFATVQSDAWSTPLFATVHLPLAALGVFVLLKAAGTISVPASIDELKLARVVAIYAALGLAGFFVSLRAPARVDLASDLGYDLAWLGVIGVGAAAFFPAKIAGLLGDLAYASATSPASRPELAAGDGEPHWVGLRQPLELPDGRDLDTADWYLAVSTTPEYVILQLEDGTSAQVSKALVFDAPAA